MLRMLNSHLPYKSESLGFSVHRLGLANQFSVGPCSFTELAHTPFGSRRHSLQHSPNRTNLRLDALSRAARMMALILVCLVSTTITLPFHCI
jgi:hypothetical protein